MRSIVTDLKELRRISEEVKKIGSAEEELMNDMYENLIAENGGVGIAAPQLGVFKRIILIKDTTYKEPKFIYMINPEIKISSGQQGYFEGCMSIPNAWAQVVRPYYVWMNYMNPYGHINSAIKSGLTSQVCGHEVDHLDGILYIDKKRGKIQYGTDEEKKEYREKHKDLLIKPRYR